MTRTLWNEHDFSSNDEKSALRVLGRLTLSELDKEVLVLGETKPRYIDTATYKMLNKVKSGMDLNRQVILSNDLVGKAVAKLPFLEGPSVNVKVKSVKCEKLPRQGAIVKEEVPICAVRVAELKYKLAKASGKASVTHLGRLEMNYLELMCAQEGIQ